MKVIVYKAKYNYILYDEIANHHNKINGIPNKLTLELYHTENGIHKGRNPFRTIVYDYDQHISYIKLNYLE